MRIVDAVPAAFMVAAAAAVFFGTGGLAMWDGVTPGARYFPAWISGAAVILAAALLWTQLRGTDRGVVELPGGAALLRVVLTVAGLAALATLAPVVGLVPALMGFSAFMLTAVLRQGPVATAVTTLIIGGGTHLVFVRLLSVPLPAPFGF